MGQLYAAASRFTNLSRDLDLLRDYVITAESGKTLCLKATFYQSCT